MLLAATGCVAIGSQNQVPKSGPAARLVLTSLVSDRSSSVLRAIDPDTLANTPGLDSLELDACSTGVIPDPTGAQAVAVTGARGWPQACTDAASASVRVLDLSTWTFKPDVALIPTDPADTPLRLDSMGRWPVAWSPDGHSVYLLTTTPAEQRRLWRVDSDGGGLPISVPVDYVPERLDVAPNGTSVFVLGGQTAGNSRQAAVVAGSAFVAIYDAKTLVERIRVPLSGLSLGTPGSPSGTLSPGVAVAKDGSRYFVVHADRPVLDVVDTRAPRLERLERSVALRAAPSMVGTRQAWAAASPDGVHLYVWHRAETPEDNLGLQVVDVRTWSVQTLDTIAERLGTSLSGQWLFELDPPVWLRPGAAQPAPRGERDPTGARLSVLDAATRQQVAVLARDQFYFNVGQYGTGHVYVSEFSRPDHATTLVAYATGSWQRIAQRMVDVPAVLSTTTPLW
jgi:hypothetical protein